ncbi:MAG: peptidoglycan bridge formation glycyltransferase FemA/FemB family protein [Anaerolineae bacterium]
MTATLQTFDRPDQQESWDGHIASTPNGHLLQSWAWGELKARFGWRTRRLAWGPACAQVLFRPLPAGLGTIAYVPMGPAADYDDSPALEALLQALEPLARQERAICLKIEPNLEDDSLTTGRLCELGLRPSPQQIQPQRTILVSLQGEPDAILGRMKQKTRYNVRLAKRKGVTVRAGDGNDLSAFYQLMETTSQRDGFGIHSQAYYQAAHQLFVPANRSRLLLAEFEGQLLAGLVVFAFGDTAIYMYGASSDAHRNRMPTYLLQWEAMLWAKEQGCRTYDLWGVPDEDEDTLEAEFTQRSDGLWGVYRFKRGFGGRLLRRVGAWDLVYAPLRYRLYAWVAGWLGQRQAS